MVMRVEEKKCCSLENSIHLKILILWSPNHILKEMLHIGELETALDELPKYTISGEGV